MNPLLQTPLYREHTALHAKMAAFAGYHMPLHYGSPIQEHLAVRAQAGLFDVSHMGVFWVSGDESAALSFLQYITTNDVSALKEGAVQYSCLVDEEGRMIDDLLLYKMPAACPFRYMLVVNAGNISSDYAWLCKQSERFSRVVLQDVSQEWGTLALQGPAADALLARVFSDHRPLPRHTVSCISFLRTEIWLSATGYTGSGGYELYLPAPVAVPVWRALLEAGQDTLKPAGLVARDSLRLEMGYCLYGQDADSTTSPLEAGLGWITRLNKGDFIGRTALLHQKREGVGRHLVGFAMETKGIPRAGYPLLNPHQQPIGRVTSGGFSPSLRKGIGMGYVPTPHCKAGALLYVAIRDTPHAVRVTPPPFYRKH